MNDKQWQIAVQEKAKNVCEMCYQPSQVAHHIFTRKHKATRHDIDNGISLCQTHHDWFHRNPKASREWIEEYRGKKNIQSLERKALSIYKV